MKVALVTGGSRGIGAAIVRRLARDGYAVHLCYHQAEAEAEAVARETDATPHRCDLGDAEQADALLANVLKARSGRLDLLVNNAAHVNTTAIGHWDAETFGREIAVNLRAPFLLMQGALVAMREGSSIVNVSSINATMPTPSAAVYSAAKAGLDALTIAFAREAGPKGIRVNAVAPGATGTDKHDPEMSPFVGRTALERIGEPEDVADVVAWLASDEARWVTGEVVRASGGFF